MHGSKVKVAYRIKERESGKVVTSSDTPLKTISIDDPNSWLYSLIGQGSNAKKKFNLDDNLKVSKSRTSKHVVMFMVVSIDNSHLK